MKAPHRANTEVPKTPFAQPAAGKGGKQVNGEKGNGKAPKTEKQAANDWANNNWGRNNWNRRGWTQNYQNNDWPNGGGPPKPDKTAQPQPNAETQIESDVKKKKHPNMLVHRFSAHL